MSEKLNVAILIDSEDMSMNLADDVFLAAEGYGEVVVKRAYGDWSKKGLLPWIDYARGKGIRLIQASDNTGGTPTSEKGLIADAIQLLYTSNVDVICMASESGDLSTPATMIRENGFEAVGIGTDLIPAGARAAFSDFVEIGKSYRFGTKSVDTVADDVESQESGKDGVKSSERKKKRSDKMVVSEDVRNAVLRVMRESESEDGYVFLSAVTKGVKKYVDGFNASDYGGMMKVIDSLGFFTTTLRAGSDGRKNLAFVKFKDGMRRSHRRPSDPVCAPYGVRTQT